MKTGGLWKVWCKHSNAGAQEVYIKIKGGSLLQQFFSFLNLCKDSTEQSQNQCVYSVLSKHNAQYHLTVFRQEGQFGWGVMFT